MLKQAIPNVFVEDFKAALAYYTGPLGFHPLFIYGDVPFYAHVAREGDARHPSRNQTSDRSHGRRGFAKRVHRGFGRQRPA